MGGGFVAFDSIKSMVPWRRKTTRAEIRKAGATTGDRDVAGKVREGDDEGGSHLGATRAKFKHVL